MRYCLAALAALMLSTLPAAAMPKGSYLKRPATTTESLIRQVSQDASVRKRYATYFRTSDSFVVNTIKELKLIRLDKSMKVRVRYWRADNGFHDRMLSKGTLVFATNAGTPVLLQECGNPIELLTLGDLKTTKIETNFPLVPYDTTFPIVEDHGVISDLHYTNVNSVPSMPDLEPSGSFLVPSRTERSYLPTEGFEATNRNDSSLAIAAAGLYLISTQHKRRSTTAPERSSGTLVLLGIAPLAFFIKRRK